MADSIFIQVRHKEFTPVGEYNDAQYFPQAQYASVPQSTIDAEKNKRVAAFVFAIQNPPPPVELTKIQLQDAIAVLDIQKADLVDKLAKAK